jgi:ubiquinone/menaquinone biosynthesis C-methylase UbiE
LVARAESLPFADSSFRTVVASHIIGHLLAAERKAAVAEVARVLAPGGTVHVREFSGSDLRAKKGSTIEAGTVRKGTGVRTHFFDEDELKKLFAAFEARRMYRIESKKNYRGEEALRSEVVAEFCRPVA